MIVFKLISWAEEKRELIVAVMSLVSNIPIQRNSYQKKKQTRTTDPELIAIFA